MPPETDGLAVGQITAENRALLEMFPLGFSLDEATRIVALGHTLARIAPALLGKVLSSVAVAQKPKTELSLDGVAPFSKQLFFIKVDGLDVVLRGQFVWHVDDFSASFAGTAYVITTGELLQSGIRKDDLPPHEMTLDIISVTLMQRTQISELSAMAEQLTEEIALRKKTKTAERSLERQLSLAADLRLVVRGDALENYECNDATRCLVANETLLKSTSDSDLTERHSLTDAIPVLREVDGLDGYLLSQNKSFKFEFVHSAGAAIRYYEGQCERFDESYVMILIRDVTDARILSQDLEYRANYDQLTGLANRTRLFRELSAIYEKGDQRVLDSSFLLFIDMDNFKSVNDTLGHSAGDRLLQVTGKRIKSSLRDTDLVGRIGGDEFAAIVYKGNTTDDVLDQILGRMQHNVCKEVELSGISWPPEVSIGVAPLNSASTANEIMVNADLTMYIAKESSADKIHRFSAEIGNKAKRDIKIRQALRNAIEQEKLYLHYQPVFDLQSNRIVALEALARWDDEELGSVPPDLFIDIAEKSDLIFSLTDYVLRSSSSFMVSALKEHLIDNAVRLHVNISTINFHSADFPSDVMQIATQAGLPLENLVLEMTESVIVEDEKGVRENLERMSAKGIGLAIDDFGKGYSSLGYLEAYPFDILKIDRKFVENLHERAVPHRLSTAIIGLAQALNMKVIAEGIESRGELDALIDIGCTLGQGFLMGKPMPIDSLRDTLVQSKSAA